MHMCEGFLESLSALNKNETSALVMLSKIFI